MVIALIFACTLVGLFFGYAVRASQEVREARYEISGYQQEELRYTDRITSLEADVKAYDVSLKLLLAEGREESALETKIMISTTGKIHQTYLPANGVLRTSCTNYPVPVDGSDGWTEVIQSNDDPGDFCKRCFG